MAGRSTRSLAVMADAFNFNQPGLLPALAAIVAGSAILSWTYDGALVMLNVGFGLMMLGGAMGRVRVGRWLSYPEPSRLEGSIVAIGVALMLGAVIELLSRVLPWRS